MARDLRTEQAQRPPLEPVVRSIRPHSRADQRPELKEAIAVLRLRRWSILSITVLMTGVALFFASRQQPAYTSEAKVLVTAVGVDLTTNQIQEPNLATEAQVVDSEAVARLVAQNIHYSGDPRNLLDGLGVSVSPDTEILGVRYSSHNQHNSQQLAQAFAEGYLQFRNGVVHGQLQETSKGLRNQIKSLQRQLTADLSALDKLSSAPRDDPRVVELSGRITALESLIQQKETAFYNLPVTFTAGRVIQPADLPTRPSSPNIQLDVIFGLAAGLALGIGIAFLRDRLSGRLRSADEVEEHAGAPVVGAIPRIHGRQKRRALMLTNPYSKSGVAEAYGFFRTNVLSRMATHHSVSVLVTSPHLGDGKSATVANLGVVLARAGKRVILVSADLRRPSLGEYFHISGDYGGLTEVLTGAMTLEDALVEVPLERRNGRPAGTDPTTVRLLMAGRTPDDPAVMLGSEPTHSVIQKLQETADIVLIDAPPILPVTDALVLAPIVDSVLLVIGPTSMTRSAVSSSRQALDRVDGRLLGVVLSRAEIQPAQYSS